MTGKLLALLIATTAAASSLAVTAALADRARVTNRAFHDVRRYRAPRYPPSSYYPYDCMCGPEYYPSVPADFISRSIPGCNGVGC